MGRTEVSCLDSCFVYLIYALVSFRAVFSPNSLLLGFLMQLEIWPPWWWLVWSVSWALKWSCFPLSPVVSLYVGGGCWLVWPPSWALKWSCFPLSPFMWGVVGVVASRTNIFRNQNHRFQSKFVYCKLFGVYASVISSLKQFFLLAYFTGFKSK